jgi:hypothetical protein
MSIRIRTTLAITAALALGGAPTAIADSSSSSNWAGYAVHRSGVRFHEVFATWRQPALTCVPGSPSYSAFWVGIGGYSLNAPALEQVGTEADCRSSGRSVASAWYELVPAASKPLKLAVQPGDEIAGSVTVAGHTVVIALQDRTRHRSAKRTLHAAVIDNTSAEWIAEAPSDCSRNSCQTLPLANFGSTSFGVAGAQTTSGRIASIGSSGWQTTKITLGPGGQQYASYRIGTVGSATPSALTTSGSAFSITYAAVRAPGAPVFASQRVRLVHAGLF